MKTMSNTEFITIFGPESSTWDETFSRGGTWCYCWDDEVHTIDADPEPTEIQHLTENLVRVFPGIDMDHLALAYVIDDDSHYESDWYGGCEYFGTISITGYEIKEALINKGYLEIVDSTYSV